MIILHKRILVQLEKYTLAGELEREIRDACEVLPEPHIHSRHFEKFNLVRTLCIQPDVFCFWPLF
jgi:hypothetical protein